MNHKFVDDKSCSKALVILHKNEYRGRTERNYAKKIASDFDVNRSYISSKLNLMARNIVSRDNSGKKVLFSIDWDETKELLLEEFQGNKYLNLSNETISESATDLGKDLERHVQELSRQNVFWDLFKCYLSKISISYSRELVLLFEEFIKNLEFAGESINNLEGSIDIETDKDKLILQERDKEFISNLKEFSEDYNTLEYNFDLSGAFRTAFKEVFGIELFNEPIAIESRALKR